MNLFEQLSAIDLLIAFVAWLIPVATSIWAVLRSKVGTPDYYAAPKKLCFCYTEANTLTTDGKPQKGALTIKITNLPTSPARDLKLVVIPISKDSKITCDEKYETMDGPFGSKIIKLERIAPSHTAIVDVIDSVTEYPPSFGTTLGNANFKYQYFPSIVDVQTEFGSVPCNFEQCARFCLRLEDDGGIPDNHVPIGVSNEIGKMLKEKFPGIIPIHEFKDNVDR